MKASEALPEGLPPLGASRPPASEEVTGTVLGNGLTVWIARRPGLPLSAFRLVARGGRGADPHDHPGLSDLVAAGLKEGTRSRTGAELAAMLQGAGAELTTAAGPDALVLAAQGLSSRARTVLDALADVVLTPAFPDAGVERVKALALEELATNESEPAFLARRALSRALYGDHPYAVVAPERSTIEAADPVSLAGAFHRLVRPDRSLLLVAGDVDPAALLSRVERRFGGWTSPAAEAPDPGEAPARDGFRRIRLVPRPGSVQAVLAVGGLGLTRRDPDAHGLRLAVTVYGGAFASRLVDNLRSDKGYTYAPHASASWLRGRGSVRTTAAVRTEVAGAALNEVFYELDRMGATEPAAEEMERARRRDAGAHALRLETLDGLLSELAEAWVAGLPAAELNGYVSALPRLTAAEVRRVSRRLLPSARAEVVAVGDPERLREELAPFGPLEDAPSL